MCGWLPALEVEKDGGGDGRVGRLEVAHQNCELVRGRDRMNHWFCLNEPLALLPRPSNVKRKSKMRQWKMIQEEYGGPGEEGVGAWGRGYSMR